MCNTLQVNVTRMRSELQRNLNVRMNMHQTSLKLFFQTLTNWSKENVSGFFLCFAALRVSDIVW